MHDINKIRENKNFFADGWKKRGLKVNIDNIPTIIKKRKELLAQMVRAHS